MLNRVREKCREKMVCAKGCNLLRDLDGLTPKQIAAAVLDGHDDPKVMEFVLNCSLCGLCTEGCVMGLDIPEMVRQARQHYFDNGSIDPDWYRHLWVDHDWNAFSIYRDAFDTEAVYRQFKEKACDVLFFPGCMLTNEGPELVQATAQWLSDRGMNVGVLDQCCGAPLKEMGLKHRTDAYGNLLKKKILESKATTLVTSCPTCHRQLERYLEAEEISIRSLYQMMTEAGIKVPVKGRVTVHDSCSDRCGNISRHVRDLLMPDELVEMPHTGKNTICCGSGGVVSAIDPERCHSRAQHRMDEASGTGAETCVVYCMACAHRLNSAADTVDVRHILELFFDHLVDHDLFNRRNMSLWQGTEGEKNMSRMENAKLLRITKP